MKEEKKFAESSLNLGGFIFLLFLTLKLAEIGQVATWSWWWVTSPLWIPFAAILITMMVMAIISIITSFFNN